ncbi:MAG: isochorismatase family protein [Oscillibacter sp.]|nr:isochorismatase family protein [Oscillibacter sp.]
MVTIKQAAERTNLTVRAIRHYEKIGLCVPSIRSGTGYRDYSDEDLARLRQIRSYRDMLFSLEEIAALLDAPKEEVYAAMERQYFVVQQRLKDDHHALAVINTFLGSEPAKPKPTGRLAVIGIDLQNDILEGGALPCKRIGKIVPALQALFQEARQRDVPVIYVCDCHKKGDAELELWNDHMIEGTWGAQVIQELTPQPGDYVVHKNLFNGFVNTGLQAVLDSLDVHTLLFTGWRTDVCISQTAIAAFYMGFRVIIAEDGVNSTSEHEHQNGLSLMQINYNFEMYPCASALRILLDAQ